MPAALPQTDRVSRYLATVEIPHDIEFSREFNRVQWAEYWSRPRVSVMSVHTRFGDYRVGGRPSIHPFGVKS